ncbi:MAG TPA: SGNH/GDSL hydrolase family protein [Clostridia bacterium]|nr:SGNH/GDSL hydrolase family protein [Clostridia bacterium]
MKEIKRVLILGNSITRHGPLPEIGWPYNWGMAASCKEKDYVHVLMGKIQAVYKNAEVLYFNIADFERYFYQSEYECAEFVIELANQWKPDLVILRIGECTEDDKARERNYGKYYRGLIERLREPGDAIVLCVSCVGRNKNINDLIHEAAVAEGCEYIDISFIDSDPANKALGLFEHGGVAGHPGDLGMRRIAEAIWDRITKVYGIK